MTAIAKSNIISELQGEILRLQGFKPSSSIKLNLGVKSLMDAFPTGTFPLGAMHEFLFECSENIAATHGFIASLLSSIMQNNGIAVWIGSTKSVFAPALANFGVHPDRIIFINVSQERELMWAVEEALKCAALSAVVAELKELSFTASRRLQLAVEQSQVTGFITRKEVPRLNTTACVSRWKISSLPSGSIDDLPGIGFPSWNVNLLKIRNGKPGVWHLQWNGVKFEPVTGEVFDKETHAKDQIFVDTPFHQQAG